MRCLILNCSSIENFYFKIKFNYGSLQRASLPVAPAMFSIYQNAWWSLRNVNLAFLSMGVLKEWPKLLQDFAVCGIQDHFIRRAFS